MAEPLARAEEAFETSGSTPVSVVLTVLNEAGTISGLLEELLAQDLAADEIIVVDGGSHDGTVEAVRRVSEQHRQIRLIRAPGANISQGRNRGIAEARCEVIAVTDAGVRINPGWLRLITEPLRSGRADVVAGSFEPDPRSPFETAMGATVLPELRDIDPRTFLPSSRSVAFRKAAWQEVGGYPEWLDYCEDIVFDLNLRAGSSLRVAYEPSARVRFRPRSNMLAFFRQYFRYARGDGKADLWRRRHAARYLAYAYFAANVICLLLPDVRRHRMAVFELSAVTLAGTALYLRKPLRRLLRLGRGATPGQWLCMLALLPAIRVTGDVAKMAGYPAGWLWRLRNRPPDWHRP